jgi:hypothetical protein
MLRSNQEARGLKASEASLTKTNIPDLSLRPESVALIPVQRLATKLQNV